MDRSASSLGCCACGSLILRAACAGVRPSSNIFASDDRVLNETLFFPRADALSVTWLCDGYRVQIKGFCKLQHTNIYVIFKKQIL